MTTQKKLPLTRTAFQPTPEMIKAAEALFVTMAFEQSVRETVEGYQKKILAERPWPVRPDFVDYAKGSTITNPKDTFMMSEDDLAKFATRCNEERVIAKLHVERDDYCPLLVAEGLVRDAKKVLVDEMYPIIGMTAQSIMERSVTDFDKMVDLTLKLLAEFVKDAPAILAEYSKKTT